MAAPAYTETFLRLIGGGVTKEWNVPANMRAVVKSLVICQRAATDTLVQVYLANTVLYYAVTPGVAATHVYAFTAVAYEGEPIGAYQSNSGCHITISGYLLRDPEGSIVPHGQTDRYIGPPVPELPEHVQPRTE